MAVIVDRRGAETWVWNTDSLDWERATQASGDGGATSDVNVLNFPATQAVSATNLDIRDLAFAADKVDVSGSSITVATHAVTTDIPQDTHNTTLNSPLLAVPVGGGNATLNQFYMLPVMANNWDRPTSNNQALSVVLRNGIERDGFAKVLDDFIPGGGVDNAASTSVKMQFSQDWLAADSPANSSFGLVTRQFGQGYITSGSISVVGNRATVNSRRVVKAATLFKLTNNSFVGTLRPVVSLDGGSTWDYVIALNATTGVAASTYVDGAASGTFCIPFGAGATNYGFEVTARTSGSITWQASANSIGTNGIFTLATIQDGGNSITVDATNLSTKEARSATPTQTSVNDTASSTTLLASNANRLGATVFNDSTEVLYLKLGATASATSFTCKIAVGGYYEVPFNYTGVIDGIWANDAAGAARITELT